MSKSGGNYERVALSCGSGSDWPAAVCIAARIRVYVPHRQMFPRIARSMSASVGAVFVANSAAACINCPLWQ
jgi:hypothetical protein